MLIEQTLFGIVDKVQNAVDLLRQYEPHEGYYLCFSGGKDSVVIYELAKRAGVKFDAHFNITTVDPPELMKFVRDNFPNVTWERPQLPMYRLILKHKMLPLRSVRFCCAQLKERHGQGRVKITGIRSEESPRRAKRPQIDDDRHGSFFVHVIKDWSTEDVWQFIRENNLPYCSLYNEGFTRIGCVLCPFSNAANIQRDLKRFPAVVAMYKRACNKLWQLWQDNPKNPDWHCGEDIFNWWIARNTKTHIAEDCNSVPLFSEDDGSVL